jgi:DNA-binding NarL/FixJ family response regulator
MLQLVIIEDQYLVQQSLFAAIRGCLDVELVGAFRSGKEALAAADVLRRAQVCLLDLHLGEEQAFDFLPELRRTAPLLRFIWVTSVSTEYLLNRALDANLEGFVHKDDPLTILVTAVERVAAGGCFLSETVKQMQAGFRQNPEHFKKLLSPREQELLGLLGQGLTNQEAASLLGLSPGTVQAHRRNIMARLRLHSAADLQAYALKSGFTTPDKLQAPCPMTAAAGSSVNLPPQR